MRWGELIALRPRHIDLLRPLLTVGETIIEVSKRQSPTGERMIVKPYPKDNEARCLFGWSWAYPVAAPVITGVAVREGVEAWPSDTCCSPMAAT